MISGIIGLIISIAMAVWVYYVVYKHGGQRPWLWAIGTLVFWPLGTTIAGRNYEETAIMVVGIVGLIMTAIGLMVVISMLPILFSLPPLRA
jgi:hypothetical protein